MKTLNDFVRELNDKLGDFGNFKLIDEEYLKVILLECSFGYNTNELLVFNTKYHYWTLGKDIDISNIYVQKAIVDYVSTIDLEELFPKKKYNIIIGQDSKKPEYCNNVVSAYRKNGLNDFFINDNTCDSLLADYDYQFTESEIEKLKATLPENMAKIVDLGTKEVKNEDD